MTKADTDLPLILIVDDTASNIETLVAVLDGHYELSAATSGQQALVLLANGLRPDLILLDVMMPTMDGYEVCFKLKADEALRDIPVIYITAKTGAASETRALSMGAVDFIHKPINPAVVRARVGLHLGLVRQRRQLEQLNQNLTQSLQEKHLAELALSQAHARELAMSSVIQQELLFGVPPEQLQGFLIASYTEPAQGVAGDFFTFTQLGPSSFEVLTGDVMGKGISAALIAAGVKNAYLTARADLAVRQPGELLPSPAALVNSVHAQLTPRLIDLNSFVTMSLLRFDLGTQTVTWVIAGHTPTLLAQHATSQVVELLGDNLPIGVLAAEVYQQHVTRIEVGDMLMIYSDGLSEAFSPSRSAYGDEHIKHILTRSVHKGSTPSTTIEELRQDLQAFTQHAQADDDCTVVLIQLASGLETRT